MDVITEIVGNINQFGDNTFQKDPVLLTSDQRTSPHMIISSEEGRNLRISLPRGEELDDGDILLIDAKVLVIVNAAPENLFIVQPNSSIDWAIAGFQLGNLHRPVRFTGDAMLTPVDPMVADILSKLDISYSQKKIPFSGRRVGAWGVHSHEH